MCLCRMRKRRLEPEQPAKKPVTEEAVFAGNKNLRSEDQKYREINDDRQAIPTHMPEIFPVRRLAAGNTTCMLWRFVVPGIRSKH